MPTFSNEVPDDPRGPALPIIRTPARKSLVATVTSEDLVGCMTHYWKKRTMPCEKPDCEPCRNGMPYRWHAYMGAWDAANAVHFLFEVTARTAEQFVTYRNAHGTLRGCHFRATRWRSNPNGRIILECKPIDLAQHPIPKAPNLIAVLSVLWDLPAEGIKTDHRDSQEDTACVDVTDARSIINEHLERIGSGHPFYRPLSP